MTQPAVAASLRMSRVVLASRSPRRAKLLALLLEGFEVDGVDVEEVAPRALSVGDAVEVIARKKALAASQRNPDAWCLAGDTVVVLHEQLVDKARDELDMRRKLNQLQGETHQVWTGLALAWEGRVVDGARAVSAVHMARLPVAVLDAYAASGAWQGKAGGYGVQDELLRPFVQVQSGPWSNVVGLPLAQTRELLTRNGIACKPLPDEAAVPGLLAL
jgi:septum formation protein